MYSSSEVSGGFCRSVLLFDAVHCWKNRGMKDISANLTLRQWGHFDYGDSV